MATVRCVLSAFLCALAFCAQASEPAPVRLAVGLISAPPESGELGRLTSILPELLTVELSKATRFQLVERTRIDAALAELSLSASGALSATNVLRLGQILCADWLVSGSIVATEKATNVWIKVIDLRQGIVVAVEPLPCVEGQVAKLAQETAQFVTHTTSRRQALQSRCADQ